MKLQEYIKYVLNTDYLYKLDWYFTFFTIPKDLETNRYLVKREFGFEVLVNSKWEILEEIEELPVLTFNYPIKLKKGDLLNLEEDVDTTLGRIISNQVLLVRNFGNKIKYYNKRFSIKDIEKEISKGLRTNDITVNEYLMFTNSVEFLQGLAPISNTSATYKNVLPPPDLDKKKKEIQDMFNQKYGPKWKTERLRVVEYQEELKKLDKEWLADDPSNGKLLGSKIKDNARVKMFLTFGPEVGFDKSGDTMTFVENSLMEQYENDPKQLTAVFNAARSGSYDRGKETQKGGAAAKSLLRSTSSYTIEGEDCGSKLGKTFIVTKENAKFLNGRYMIVGKDIKLIENAESLISKVIEVRSPMYCMNKGSSYCVKCSGESMRGYKSGVSMNVLSISNAILTNSLKAMHVSNVKLKNVNIINTFLI